MSSAPVGTPLVMLTVVVSRAAESLEASGNTFSGPFNVIIVKQDCADTARTFILN